MNERTDGYAMAVVDLASAEGQLDLVERQLLAVGNAVESSSDLVVALSDPRLEEDRKHAIVEDLIGRTASPVTVAVVEMIVGLGRAADLPTIARRVAEIAASGRGRQAAEVRSAVELDQATIDRLAAALERIAGAPVELHVVVDPNVLGGLIVQVGDTVIDGSIRSRLGELRDALSVSR